MLQVYQIAVMTARKMLPEVRVADPDLFGRIRKIFTGSGSGSYRYLLLRYVKLYKEKNILKIELLHIFR